MPRSKHRLKTTKEEKLAARSAIWPDDDRCPFCARVMNPGATLNEHHLIPRSYGGIEKYVMHRVCHSKIHSVISEHDLALTYNTFAKLREQPELKQFIKWIRKQDPGFMTKHRRPREASL